MTTWWLDLLPVAMLGAVLGLDVVSFPQAMLSRPIVAATLAGALLGAPVQGLVMGAVLELFALETLPVGASRYPEWGSASVVAGAIFAAQPPDRGGALAIATVVGLLTATVGTYSMVIVRRLNAYWARNRLAALERGSARVVTGLQVYGLTADLLRGFLLTGAALAVARVGAEFALPRWHTPTTLEYIVVTAVATTVAAAALWRLHHSERAARRLFAAGVAVGCLALLFR